MHKAGLIAEGLKNSVLDLVDNLVVERFRLYTLDKILLAQALMKRYEIDPTKGEQAVIFRFDFRSSFV